jgi:hypothetical protein
VYYIKYIFLLYIFLYKVPFSAVCFNYKVYIQYKNNARLPLWMNIYSTNQAFIPLQLTFCVGRSPPTPSNTNYIVHGCRPCICDTDGPLTSQLKKKRISLRNSLSAVMWREAAINFHTPRHWGLSLMCSVFGLSHSYTGRGVTRVGKVGLSY